MVDVVTKVLTQDQQMQERVARMNKLQHRPGIRVEPANEDMRRLLRHPRAGRFRDEGSLEWPDDTFTYRRLRDGDIKRVEEKAEPKAEPRAKGAGSA